MPKPPTAESCTRQLADGSICGNEDMAAGHQWCKGCKAAYQKNYERDRLDIIERRGFARGVAAYREFVITMCRQRIGGFSATGNTFAAWIEGEKPPEFTPSDAG